MQPGSLLECISENWDQSHNVSVNVLPKKGDIFTYNGESSRYSNMIYLLEYPMCPCGCGRGVSFKSRNFKEVQPPMDIKIEDIISEPVNV